MEAVWYRDPENRKRPALVARTGRERTRIRLVVIGPDVRPKLETVEKTEERYMAPMDLGVKDARKVKATWRRLARKKGVSRNVRAAIKAALEEE